MIAESGLNHPLRKQNKHRLKTKAGIDAASKWQSTDQDHHTPSRRATINELSFKQRRTTNSATQDLNSETTFAKQKPTTMTRRLSDYDQLHLKKSNQQKSSPVLTSWKVLKIKSAPKNLGTSNTALSLRLHHQIDQSRAILAEWACHLRDGCKRFSVVSGLIPIGHTGAVSTLIGNVGRLSWLTSLQEGVSKTAGQLSIRWLPLSGLCPSCLRDECQTKSGNEQKGRAHQQKTNDKNLTENC